MRYKTLHALFLKQRTYRACLELYEAADPHAKARLANDLAACGHLNGLEAQETAHARRAQHRYICRNLDDEGFEEG